MAHELKAIILRKFFIKTIMVTHRGWKGFGLVSLLYKGYIERKKEILQPFLSSHYYLAHNFAPRQGWLQVFK